VSPRAVPIALCLAVALAGCGSTLDKRRSSLVDDAKRAGLIDTRLPANCTRILSNSSWVAIDQPLWNLKERRCSSHSHKAMIVFHKVGGSWRIVTVRKQFGHFGSCRVPGVPLAVSRTFPFC
jgi:hypothetical protein